VRFCAQNAAEFAPEYCNGYCNDDSVLQYCASPKSAANSGIGGFVGGASRISKKSRYAACILLRDGRGDSLGTRQCIDTTPRRDDRFHTVIEADRLDLIAHRYLGDARLWWIIPDYNDVFFPLELEVGTVLRVPSVEHVKMRILP